MSGDERILKLGPHEGEAKGRPSSFRKSGYLRAISPLFHLICDRGVSTVSLKTLRVPRSSREEGDRDELEPWEPLEQGQALGI